MQQLLSSQVLTCVGAAVRESPTWVRLSCYILRPKSRLHFLHTQLPLLVFAAIFPIGESALLACERRAGTNRDAEEPSRFALRARFFWRFESCGYGFWYCCSAAAVAAAKARLLLLMMLSDI